MTDGPFLPPWPRVWAHRGGGSLAPENTLAGIAQALALGCRGIEFDVMLTADGTPVLIHDETVDRTTDGTGRVADLSAGEMARLDAGAWFGAHWRGESIPTLAQALTAALAGGLFMNVEIKPATGHDSETGRVVGEAVGRALAGREGRVVLSSFSEAALAAVRAAAPDLPRGLLVGRIPGNWLERCRALGCIALHCDVRSLSAGAVAAVRGAGLRLAAYTENAPDRAARYLAWGLDALITDRPDLIREPAGSNGKNP